MPSIPGADLRLWIHDENRRGSRTGSADVNLVNQNARLSLDGSARAVCDVGLRHWLYGRVRTGNLRVVVRSAFV